MISVIELVLGNKLEALINNVNSENSIFHLGYSVLLQALSFLLYFFDQLFGLKYYASTLFYVTLFLSLLSLYLYTSLPSRYLLNTPVALRLDQLHSHRLFLARTRYFYKSLTRALTDMIFARTVNMQAPVQFESDEEEEGKEQDEDCQLSSEEEFNNNQTETESEEESPSGK